MLATQIERYLQELAREGASPNTIAAYEADLRQFLDFLSPPELAPPEPPEIDLYLAFAGTEALAAGAASCCSRNPPQAIARRDATPAPS